MTKTKKKYYEISVLLDNVLFSFEFYWNERASRFFLSLYDSEYNLIISSVPIVLKIPIFHHINNKNFPKGKLIFIDTTNSIKKYNYDDFGTKIKLYYLE